jgi:methylmalonyl-CoA epimerase
MALTKVDHIGMVVGDLNEARRVYCDVWGLRVNEDRTPLPEGKKGHFDNVNSIEIPIGELYLEFSKPNDPDSEAGKFLTEARGVGGMHHLALGSDNIADDVKRLQGNGIKLHPNEGSWDGQSSVFLDPETSMGILIELVPHEYYYPHPSYRGTGLITGLAHVGLAAKEVADSTKFWEDVMGLALDHSRTRGDKPEDRERSGAGIDPVHLTEFPLGGTVIEISHPTTEDSGSARFVQSRATLGAAFHHICPWAPDVHAVVDSGNAGGLQQIGSIPAKEEVKQGQNIVGWFHPKTCLGTLIEVWCRPSKGW